MKSQGGDLFQQDWKRKGPRRFLTRAQRKGHARTQQEGSRLHAKERGLGRSQTCRDVILDFQPPKLWEKNFCCLSPQSMVFYYGSPSRPEHPPSQTQIKGRSKGRTALSEGFCFLRLLDCLFVCFGKGDSWRSEKACKLPVGHQGPAVNFVSCLPLS